MGRLLRLLLLGTVSSGLLTLSAALPGALDFSQAFAKDGGSSGSGSGSDGGGGSSSGHGGSDSSGSSHDGDGGGDDGGGSESDGGSSSGHGGDADRGERSRSGSDDDGEGSKGRGRNRSEARRGGDMEIVYSDGWSESVRGSRYVLRDAGRRVVVQRAARQSDRVRLRNLGR